MTIKGVNNFSDNGYNGLSVWSSGAITISNITANGNGKNPSRPAETLVDPDGIPLNGDEYYMGDAAGKGVALVNYGASTPKNVVISGVNTFNNNASNGLDVDSYGTVTVSNITANSNGCNLAYELNAGKYCAGAFLEGFGVTQTGYGRFENNVADGLIVLSYKGTALLNNLYADGNGLDGVSVTSGQWVTTPINVTIKGVNVFTNNRVGLEIISNGLVTLSNITANYNSSKGTTIDNSSAATPKAVVITGSNNFNNNTSYGLEVLSYGAITTNNVTANFNNYAGVYLDNCDRDSNDDDNDGDDQDCLAYLPQPITMNGTNVAIDDGYTGIWVQSRGAITVSNITAKYNNSDGVYLSNNYSNGVGNITQKGYATLLNNNGPRGLFVHSVGSVTLANVTAENNNYRGVQIDNYYYVNPVKPANVTITGVNSFSGNTADGLRIYTYGAVVLNNITANNNGDAIIPQDGNGVFIDNKTDSTKAMPVTINGNNTFNGNFGTGLDLISLGAIKVNNLMASYNHLAGAILENKFGLFSSPVTLSGYVIVNNNGSAGLEVYSNGHVKTSNVTANNNQGRGVYINNEWNATPNSAVNVTMSGINFFNKNDGLTGLMIISDGAITLSNISANSNVGYGAYLNAGKNININGSNTFNSNKFDGLYFNSGGNVSLTRVTADSNNDTMAGFPSSAGILGTASGNITISCGSLNFNEGAGYSLTVGGGKAITLKGVLTFGNGAINNALTPNITRACPLP